MPVDQGSTLLHFARNGDFAEGGADLTVIERGEGTHVFDTEGRRYVDGLSSLFCAQIGYSHGEEMAAAVAGQMTKLAFSTLWGTAHPAALELAEKLADIAPAGIDRVFFTNGGSESVESAWKLARQYHDANGEPQRRKAIARRNAYHGVTLGALSLTGVPRFKEMFDPPAIDVRHVEHTGSFRSGLSDQELCAARLAEIEETIQAEGPDTIAMIIAEPVQNAGGCLVPPEGYWPGLREIADRHGILLVADEVITGFGRLGEWFGVTRFGAVPDLITTAKGITSAYLPMGAVFCSEKVAAPLYEDKRTLLHGITFAGHPACAAVAIKNLEIFEREGVLENVRAHEAGLKARLETLRELPVVGDVRGCGFFWAVEFVNGRGDGRLDAEERESLLRGFLPGSLRAAGLIARADDRGEAVLQIAPPLVADDAVLDEIVDAMRTVLVEAGEFMGLSTPAAA